MEQKKAQVLLSLLNSKVTAVRSGWVIGHCPFGPFRHGGGKDAHPSFGIKHSPKKESICKCFSCGFGGKLIDLVRELGIELKKSPMESYKLGQALQLVATEFEGLEFDPEIPDYDEVKKHSGFLEYPDWWLESFPKVQWPSVASEYLLSRNISKAMCETFDIRHDPIQNRVVFPFRDLSGRLAGAQGRAMDDVTEPRYFFYDYGHHKNMEIWLGEHHVNFDKPVVVVEGPFDYASVYRLYQNVVASFSVGIGKAKVKRMADAVEIITFYDYGKGGDSARKRLAEVMKGVTPVVDIVPPDAEMDPGAMPLGMVKMFLQDHVKLTPLA